MPKVSASHRAARREQILQAAYRCFGHKGFHGTTIRDICAEARLSPGAVYGYFAGKDAILEALAEERRRWKRALIEDVQPFRSARSQLLAVVDLLFRQLEGEEAQRRTRIDLRLLSEALHTPRLLDLVRQGVAGVLDPLARLVRRAQEEGGVDAGVDPASTARLLLSILHGFAIQQASDPSADLTAYRRLVARLLERGLLSPPEEHP